jgi:hypothetical protein
MVILEVFNHGTEAADADAVVDVSEFALRGCQIKGIDAKA